MHASGKGFVRTLAEWPGIRQRQSGSWCHLTLCFGLVCFIGGFLCLLSYSSSTALSACIKAGLSSSHYSSLTARSKGTVRGVLARYPDIILVKDSAVFWYIIDGLSAAFNQLGLHHSVVGSLPADSNTSSSLFILCTTHEGHPLPKNYIAYNFEQLGTDKGWPVSLFERYRAAVMVWDYSFLNIQILANYGIKAVHVPLGFIPSVELPVQQPPINKSIDVMAAMSMNERRRSVLQQLNTINLKTFIGLAVGGDLATLYRTSKVAVNVHYYGGATNLEVHRIVPLISNRLLVVSERSNDTQLDEAYLGLVDFTTPSTLRVVCAAAVHRPDYQVEVLKRYLYFRSCCHYYDYVAAALNDTWAEQQ